MSAGAVFHPGHDELHGMTVVLLTDGPRTYVGRWDSVQDGMIHMVGVSMHEKDRDQRSREDFLTETKTYGIAVQFPRLTVPEKEVKRVVKLADIDPTGLAR